MPEKKLKNALKRTAEEESAAYNGAGKKKPMNKAKKVKDKLRENEDEIALDPTNSGSQLTKKQKRKAEDNIASNEEKTKKPKKKEHNETVENIIEESSVDLKGKSMKTMDTSIFQYFTDLTQPDDNQRLKAATELMQKLHKTKEPEKRQKELAYTLKRLVRGCGAATNTSRAGFFTGLVAYLKSFENEELDITNIFDTIQKELHVGATIGNKEDADAVVGKILVCGALLRAGRMSLLSSEHLEKITNILLQATRHRTYHASLGYAFLNEIIETALTQQQFEEAVWPLLLKELCKPWQKQTLQTVHCLIVVQRKFPTVLNSKFLKTHFGGREIVNPESFTHLQRIFWTHSDTHIITHPAIEAFGVYLADCSSLVEFWTQTVDAGIKTQTKLLEFLTLKIATDVIINLKPEKASLIVDLLSPNFMKMLINGLKQIKLKKDETLKAFYDEFMEALVTCCSKIPPSADEHKVAVIQRLILYPGTFDIEKFTSTRVVHQLINTLGAEGIQFVFGIYQQIFCGTLAKQIDDQSNGEWQHFERLNAGYMLQHLLAHKTIQHDPNCSDWRSRKLQFLMICGLFHVQQTNADDNSFEPCKKDAASTFSKDYGEQCKNMFYASLQSKLSNLQQERQLLLQLVEFCNKHFQKQKLKHLLRVNISEKTYESLHNAWKKMMDVVNKSKTNESNKSTKKEKHKDVTEDKLQLVFEILLLNMGLQLFREVEMAAPAIDDLLNCLQRTEQQQKEKKNASKQSSNGNLNEESEPEWIEVVIDLFLHLLSQNVGAIRNCLNNLFPHLSNSLNVSAIHQILSVLDMKDGHNPLSKKGDEETDDEGEENEENQVDKSDSEDDDEESEANDSSATEDEEDVDEEDDDEEDDDEEDDDEEDNDEDEEDVTATDKLRNAISQALIANGAAVNNATGNEDDDDMASIDLNEMTEEEGRRLDEALATAFKALKKPGGSGQGSDRKKSKSKRVETTTVMHFRIRVLDLIEIYLQQPEIDLLNHIEIMLALYNMLQHCWSDELKPLQSKVEKVLIKLTTIKSAATTSTSPAKVCVDDLKPQDVVNYIRQIAEQKAPTLAFDLTNKIRNRCIVFLINSATKLPSGDVQVLDLCQQYQNEFLQSRNPTVNITLLSEIYKLRWSGIWKLALELVENGLKMETRAFRRIQVCEILAVLYKNNELQKQDTSETQKLFKKIEKTLLTYIESLTKLWSQPQARQSHKEFQTLLDLLLHAQRAHARLRTPTSLICSDDTCKKVQELRRHIRLEATHMYHRYCGTFKLSVIRNTDVVLAESVDKKQTTRLSESDNANENDELNLPNGMEKVKVTKKAKSNNALKLKKQKKIERMLAASKGINGGFGIQERETSENDVSEHESD